MKRPCRPSSASRGRQAASSSTASLSLQLIYEAGVPFVGIMCAWSGLACLIFLNCALNWPSEPFPAPEEVDYRWL